VALSVQRYDPSMLDAGISVLSLSAGPVLVASLLGQFNARVGAWPMVCRMGMGIVAFLGTWWAKTVAFTWYPVLGVVVTGGTALIAAAAAGELCDAG
jgi:hypothetical protein